MRTAKNSRLLGMILLPGICSLLLAQVFFQPSGTRAGKLNHGNG